MTPELMILAWTLVLALVQVLLPTGLRNRETGLRYNIGPRDESGPPTGKITARLQRAQSNLFETLPVFAIAVLIAHAAGLESERTYWGCVLYFIGRVVYVPLYAAGVPYLRTLAWVVSLVGLLMVLSVDLWIR
jgi:uncharacterized MAPEG superfamily protein